MPNLLSEGHFIKLSHISSLMQQFVQGDEYSDWEPYIEIKFNNGAFNDGDISYSSGEIGGILDFRNLDEAVAIIRHLMERQAAANLLWETTSLPA